MKNKLIKNMCALLAFTLFLSVFSTIAFADDTDTNGTYKYTSDTDTLEIFSDDIMIDRTESDVSKNPWFSYKSSIKHIIVHDGVTKISSLAFSRMDNLVDVVIPNSVTSIGTSAFASNDNLNKIEISDNVTSIGDYAFGFDSQMLVKSDFECVCSSLSFAQSWCLKNYVPFSTPFSSSGVQTLNFSSNKKQYYFSFVPKADCNVSFYSNSDYDTEGLIYEFGNYTYNDKYSQMKKSALCYNDDVGNDLDFKISTTLKAGKRYYLSTKFKLTSNVGSFVVNFNYSCLQHSYVANSLEQDFISGEYDILVLKCINCSDTQSMLFIDAFKHNLAIADVNNDGYVNAKDYAILKKA